MAYSKKSKKNKKAAAFAVKKFFKLMGVTAAYIVAFSLIIATVYLFSFTNTKKNDEYIIKLRTQEQTKAVTVKDSNGNIVEKGYLPISSLNGYIGFRVVGNSEGITISNPAETEIMEFVPGSNILKVNGTWKSIENVIMYKDGECYLPMELIEKYTCLSVSYDETNLQYTVSLNGNKNISFYPHNNSTDASEVQSVLK